MFNSFPNKPWFLRVYSTSLLKTLCEKEKLLVTSNFSFSHSVFFSFGELSAIIIKFKIVVCKLLKFKRVPILMFGKGLNSFTNKPWLLPVCNTSLLKTLREKENLLIMSSFSFTQSFLSVLRTFWHFRQI